MVIAMNREKIQYLQLLAQNYPNIDSASTEIINLNAILHLPKGTEHFLSDLHGEFDSFNHVIKNASGVIKNKIKDIFGNMLTKSERRLLATLIYYPEEKLELICSQEKELDEWFKLTLYRLLLISKVLASKYTRSKVRKALPKEFAYILDELLHEDEHSLNKGYYYNEIIDSIIQLDRAKSFICALSKLIQRLAIDRLHVIGDIYDRGPAAEKIMDLLMTYHSLDIEWGNHDILWMGAAAGNRACICNVIRIAARYGNLETLEDGYGINMLSLAAFALDCYENDACQLFIPKSYPHHVGKKEISLLSKLHKAITIMQFKEEGKLILNRPEFDMNHRNILHTLNLENKTVQIEGITYSVEDLNFPSYQKDHPYELTNEEEVIMKKLVSSFKNSSKLQEHARLLLSKGSMYKIYNNNLLFHGCIPLDKNGAFREIVFHDKKWSAKAYLDELDRQVREGFFNQTDGKAKKYGMDLMWYLWCGPNSPLFGKHKMATFERYFIKDKRTHVEEDDPYFKFRDNEQISRNILKEFSLSEKNSHIINGHVPVQAAKGEVPVKAGGKLYDIDGGFSKAYQSITGIAGYTLIYNSYGLILVSHEAFLSKERAIQDEIDILSSQVDVEYSEERIYIKDTDVGKKLLSKTEDLKNLLYAYRKGYIKESR